MTDVEPIDRLIPAPTLREAMRLGGFAAATRVAGGGGLDRKVEWVRVIETPETARRARPNDLLLTTAYPIRDDPAAQLEVVATVAEGGGAGLIGKVGVYVEQLPDGVTEEADRLE